MYVNPIIRTGFFDSDKKFSRMDAWRSAYRVAALSIELSGVDKLWSSTIQV